VAATPITLPSVAQLSAPSGTVVWALVAGTRLFRSSDRGDTWVEATIPPGLANVEVSFADDTNGFVLSTGSSAECQTQTASIWKTTNGAMSWQQVTATGIAEAMCKRGLASSDAAHAFFTAYGPNSGPVIYRSVNGGPTWTASKPLPDPPGFTFTKPGGVVILPGRIRAFASVLLIDAQPYGEQTRYVFRSTDGGATLAYASTAPTVEGTVAYVSETRWLQIAPPGSSKETTDGGATWHAFTTDYSQAAPIASDIVFGDSLVGYATVRGAIQRTVDGGAHWTTIKTPGT
jgi:photosystem II stability/assembly factor-like uncharacterized protein